MEIPTIWLWVALAPVLASLALVMRLLTRTLTTGRLSLGGRLIADREKSPALFWALFGEGVIVGGVFCFLLISIVVELFLVRA